MHKPETIAKLEDLGRVRLSDSFFMRDFLYSDITNLYGIPNIPDNPDLAIEAGTKLCEELLEPLNATFGRIAIRSAFRSCAVNQYGNENGFNCASNESNYADHIWDHRDKDGNMGATACIVIPWFADKYDPVTEWQSLAWWIHDHLPHSSLYFFKNRGAVNVQWRENPARTIHSWIKPGPRLLTKPGMDNNEGDHSEWYKDFPTLKVK